MLPGEELVLVFDFDSHELVIKISRIIPNAMSTKYAAFPSLNLFVSLFVDLLGLRSLPCDLRKSVKELVGE